MRKLQDSVFVHDIVDGYYVDIDFAVAVAAVAVAMGCGRYRVLCDEDFGEQSIQLVAAPRTGTLCAYGYAYVDKLIVRFVAPGGTAEWR